MECMGTGLNPKHPYPGSQDYKKNGLTRGPESGNFLYSSQSRYSRTGLLGHSSLRVCKSRELETQRFLFVGFPPLAKARSWTGCAFPVRGSGLGVKNRSDIHAKWNQVEVFQNDLFAFSLACSCQFFAWDEALSCYWRGQWLPFHHRHWLSIFTRFERRSPENRW